MEPEFLKDISKKGPFEVPEGYFSQLHGKTTGRTSGANTHITRTDRYYKTAIAACIVLLLSIFSVVQVEKKNAPLASIVHIANFDEELLVQEYLQSDFSSVENQAGEPDRAGELQQTGELERYILNQVDESLLLQEL